MPPAIRYKISLTLSFYIHDLILRIAQLINNTDISVFNTKISLHTALRCAFFSVATQFHISAAAMANMLSESNLKIFDMSEILM